MIVVLGRPALSSTWRSDAGPSDPDSAGLVGRAARIALEARAGGARVELVGSVGDDPEGDEVMVRLGKAGVGHAAVLRDPAARTPVGEGSVSSAGSDGRGSTGSGSGGPDARSALPRLDAADISLGLSYIAECRVLVLSESLPADARAVAAEAAAYHAAALIAIVDAGTDAAEGLPDDATLLEAPRNDDEADRDAGAQADRAAQADAEAERDTDAETRSDAFNRLVARYALGLDRGEDPAEAFRAASGAAGWEAVRP